MKKFKRFLLKPTGVLCFLLAVSCESGLTDDIESVEESLQSEAVDDDNICKKSEEEIIAKADEQYSRFRKVSMKMANSSQPHYVGVLLSNTATKCPAGVGAIIYHMDCQDDEPGKNDKNCTSWIHKNCYTSNGLRIDNNGNVDWYICIVDANKYNFRRMKYGYAIFDLSAQTHLNGADEIFVHSDDEDKNNANKYLNSQYGFEKNNNSNYYPYQQTYKNTEFWLYYFAPDPKSTYKLPNLGFDYDVFGNFNCCDYRLQNILLVDSEDNNNNNTVTIYQENNTGKPLNKYPFYSSYLYCEEDANIFTNIRVLKQTKNYYFGVQASRAYMTK